MKVALGLLRYSKRVADNAIANFTFGRNGSTHNKSLPPGKGKSDVNGGTSGIKQRRTKFLSVPHGRVFILVAVPSGKVVAGREFGFMIGSLLLTGRCLDDEEEDSDGSAKKKAAALLPTDMPPGDVTSAFFSALSKRSEAVSLYLKPPKGVQPGEIFEVFLLGRKVRIRYSRGGCSTGFCCFRTKSKDRPTPILKFKLNTASFKHIAEEGNKEEGHKEALWVESANRHGVRKIKNSSPPAYLVTTPDNIKAGQKFPVLVEGRALLATCPLNARPGVLLRIVPPPCPPKEALAYCPNHEGTRDTADQGFKHPCLFSNHPRPDSPDVRRIPDTNPSAYIVIIPDGVRGGQQFPLTIQGQQLMVTSPPNARPGMSVRIVPPPATDVNEGPTGSTSQKPKEKPPRDAQLFEVEVPEGAQPGKPFALLANGVRVLVTCPITASPGQRIRFKMPLALTQTAGKSITPNST